ncbi:hypothetical protein [Paenibacillus sp. JZ16]|uniref:hypothetical protein n=1 Tax=Paenibacillus sp. JZ16 TaxID=1906272 RepID=UPI001889DE91|nr:hypothetical protein [Paenibacillus sp. JZ16]
MKKEKDKPMVYLTVTLLYGKVGYLEKITHGPPFANKEGFNSERDPKKKTTLMAAFIQSLFGFNGRVVFEHIPNDSALWSEMISIQLPPPSALKRPAAGELCSL